MANNKIKAPQVEGLVEYISTQHKINEKIMDCLDKDRKLFEDLYKKLSSLGLLVQLGFFFTNLFFIIILVIYVWNKH